MDTVTSRTGIAAVVLLICGCLPAVALASRTVKLDMGFTPDRLGASTTISFGFEVDASGETLPPPVRSVDLDLPASVAYDTSTLGLTSCYPQALSTRGLGACSPNSRIGLGTAVVEVPFGPLVLKETARITTFVGNSENGHIEVLYYAAGRTPVVAQLLFSGEMFSSSSGNQFNTSLPLISTLPGGPDAAVTRFHSTLGPKHLYYYTHVHGREVRYRPRGIVLPSTCPPEGFFPFSARFTFQDGSSTIAKDRVRCPSRHPR
jgi:hypothetical protein